MPINANRYAHFIKGFFQHSRAFYAKTLTSIQHKDTVDMINIGFFDPQGGAAGEFSVRWLRVGDKITPHLEAFDDSWRALANMPELIQFMAEVDGLDITPHFFREHLLTLGFTDLTKERPE